ncbi:MAG: metallophosphoesterase, partial [Lachnospiraceae bacterium]|nr:metallophosphoesterase [Lachnospiraceae bacterium]
MKKANKKRFLVTALIALCLLVGWLVWGNTALQLNEITVSSERLPQSFDGYRIVQVSDLHNAVFGQANEKLLQLIRDAKPDMIVLTGDLVDSSHTDLDIAIRFVQKSVEIAPTYYVTGNHEAWLGNSYETLEQKLSRGGVTILRDEAMYIEEEGERILLMGLDDPEFYEGESAIYDGGAFVMQQRIDSLRYDNEVYTILLSHRPELFD